MRATELLASRKFSSSLSSTATNDHISDKSSISNYVICNSEAPNDKIARRKQSLDSMLSGAESGSLGLPRRTPSDISNNSDCSPDNDTSLDSVSQKSSDYKIRDIITCQVCGQFHKPGETHLYDYYQHIEDDVLCKICTQPLVNPLDAPCTHTFCARCLQTFLRGNSLCPECQLPIVYKDSQKSSIIVRRLLDKLLVVCPNVDYCEEVLQRCDLETHLKYSCRGTVTHCPNAVKGCQYKGPRSAMDSHRWECGHTQPSSGRKPVIDGHISRIRLEQCNRDLGISIVGGSDTPLTSIVIQEVIIGGVVAEDGRLLQGDIILEVNGEDATLATHHEALKMLSQKKFTCTLTVYREKANEQPPESFEENIKVVLSKEKNPHLGIKLIDRRNGQGVYILGLVPGSQAALDGQLRPDDRVIEINGHSLTYGTQEQAAYLIQKSADLIEIVVCRTSRPDTPDLLRSINQYTNYNEVISVKPQFSKLLSTTRCHEKFITVKKEVSENLGISIAGGKGSPRGDTPIYITNINPVGCFGKDHQLSRGDILLSVNGTSLYGLSHPDAVMVLKSQSIVSSVSLRILTSPEKAECASSNYSPSWFYWLQLPDVYQSLTVITLTRSVSGSLGFSIVGGTDSCHGSIPIYIKSVVFDTPASRDGRLRCGDMIFSVNNRSLKNVTHDEAVATLKNTGNTVTLTIVSWPGSLV